MGKKSELVGNYFGTIYLTVISLLQGIVLSQWVPNFITYTRIADNPWTDIHLVPLVLTLLIIFTVWHHYAVGIFFLRWFPNILDTIIPFVISIAQFFLLSYLNITNAVTDIDVHAWMTGYAIIVLMGSFAYFGAAWRLDADLFTNIMSEDDAREHVRVSSNYYRFFGISVVVMGTYAAIIAWLDRADLLWGSLIIFFLHLFLSEYFMFRNVKAHFVKAIDAYDAWRRENGFF